MHENLEHHMAVGLAEKFTALMNGIKLGFRPEPEQSNGDELCIVAKLDSGDTVRLWYSESDPSKYLMTSVSMGRETPGFGFGIKDGKVDIGYFGRSTKMSIDAVPSLVALFGRWRDLSLAARGNSMIVTPTR